MPPAMLADLLLLSKSITTIRLRLDIFNAHLNVVRASANIGGSYLWTTLEEKRAVDIAAESSHDLLLFYSRQRLVKDNQGIYSSGGGARTIDDIVVSLASVMAHELAHAADFIPPQEIEGIPRNWTPGIVLSNTPIQDIRVATVLDTKYPLKSLPLLDYAQVIYDDADAARLSAYSAAEMGEWFDADGAITLYGYSNIVEDVATLLAATLEKLHFDLDNDSAFIDKADDTVAWGARGRLGDPQVRVRAQLVAEHLLPRSDPNAWKTFFDGLPPSTPMETGCSWADNLDLACDPVPDP